MTYKRIGIVISAIAITGCHKPAAIEKPPTAVRTVAAQLAPAPTGIRYSGIVAPDTQVDLAFRVTGYVEQIGMVRDESGRTRELQQGDFVRAGAALARLRPAEYQTRVSYAQSVSADAAASLTALQAQLNEADASLVQSKRDYDRASALFAEKALTKADFDAAEARRDAASARREATSAQIAAQRARIEGAGAQHRDAAISLGDTTLAAPFPAVIVSKRIARGSLASAGNPAFALADTRIAKVSFGVPDLELNKFKPGDTLTVTAEALPEKEFRGRVTAISPSADPASRVFGVEISIDNSSQLLKVGMVATVTTSAEPEPAPSPAIPLSAVVKSPAPQGGFGVYAIEKQNGVDTVRLRPVNLGPVRGNVVIVTDGIKPGQLVVATAGLQLADGERVRQIP